MRGDGARIDNFLVGDRYGLPTTYSTASAHIGLLLVVREVMLRHIYDCHLKKKLRSLRFPVS